MNKKELIERIEGLKNIFWNECEYVKIDFMIELVSELDEPQKVTIPQFVADWIKYCKNTGVTLVRALLVEEIDLYNYANQKDSKKLKEFLRVEENQEKIVRAWLDGYEVKKEKRYLVKVKGHIHENILVYGYGVKRYFFSSSLEGNRRAKHTRKELEQAGFGWVFDCEGIEIEEVE